MLHNRNIYSHRVRFLLIQLPKCTLWELQNDPLMRDFNKQLVYIPKVIIISSKYPLFQFHKELLKYIWIYIDFTIGMFSIKRMIS